MKQKNALINIIKALLFVVILGFLIFNASYLLRPSFSLDEPNEKVGFYGLYAEKKDALDVVFFGSSDIFVSFMPYKVWEDHGITSYSWGRSAMRSPLFMEEYKLLSKYQKPTLLVVGVRPFIFTKEKVEETSLRNISDLLPYSSPERFRLLNDTLPYLDYKDSYYNEKTTLEKRMPFYFDIMKYHENWQDITEDSWNNFSSGNFSSPTKGFLVVDKYEKIKGPQNINTEEKLKIEDYSEESLRRFLKKLDEDQQEALFVMIPYQETIEQKKQYNYLKDIIINSGYSCIDLNDYWEEIGLDETTDYYDISHPNIFGAEKITDFLMSYINNNYDLPNHKGEEEYESWDKGLKTWHTIENNLKESIIERQ